MVQSDHLDPDHHFSPWILGRRSRIRLRSVLGRLTFGADGNPEQEDARLGLGIWRRLRARVVEPQQIVNVTMEYWGWAGRCPVGAAPPRLRGLICSTRNGMSVMRKSWVMAMTLSAKR